MQAQFCACSMGELLYGLMPNASKMKKKNNKKRTPNTEWTNGTNENAQETFLFAREYKQIYTNGMNGIGASDSNVQKEFRFQPDVRKRGVVSAAATHSQQPSRIYGQASSAIAKCNMCDWVELSSVLLSSLPIAADSNKIRISVFIIAKQCESWKTEAAVFWPRRSKLRETC